MFKLVYKTCYTVVHHRIINFSFICLYLLSATACADVHNLSEQRQQFKSAYQALQAKDWENFYHLSEGLQDYPLYYFLRYTYLNPQINSVSRAELFDFLEKYRNTAFGQNLQRNWLTLLVKDKDWSTFLQVYTPQNSPAFQCYYALARLETGERRQEALQDAKSLWLVGKSQHKACDPIFEYLYNSPLMTEELVWQRIGLAMEKGQLGLANSVSKRLSPESGYLVDLWVEMYQKPEKVLANFEGDDTPIMRKIVAQGIQRLAKKDFDAAQTYWKIYQKSYHFSNSEIGETQRELALGAFKQNHPNALQQMAKVDPNYIDEEFNQARVKFALTQQDWQAISDFATTNISQNVENSLQLRYWYARALEQLDKPAEARKEYESLTQERDYYGFLAADRLSVTYQMQHHPITFSSQEGTEVSENQSIVSAHEFNQVEMPANGRLEWEYAISKFTLRQREIAAVIASQWKWYDRAIITSAKAQSYDDLDVRFPTPYRENLEYAANVQGLDLAWVYGIVRQESAFMTDARSPAGALGLMQLMPATGRQVAKKIGTELKTTEDILNVETNVSLGTAYLREVLDIFNGNHMLATAAYNAGPGRAKQWAQEYSCLPADIWVEMIPFKETRHYVRLVLFYTNVFETRLNQQPRPLRVALAPDENCIDKVDDQNVLQVLKSSSIENLGRLAENPRIPYTQ